MGEHLWNKTHFPVQASVLDEGLHDFTVERIIALYDDSITLGFNVNGRSIAQRIYFDSDRCTTAKYLLASVGLLKDINTPWLTSELANTVGRSGRCIVGRYNINGRDENNIKAYIAPWADEQDQLWRYLVLKEANNICQSCGKPGYDAHHKKPKECYPEARYDISNGMCLCRECHKKWHDTYGIMKIGGPGLDGNQ